VTPRQYARHLNSKAVWCFIARDICLSDNKPESCTDTGNSESERERLASENAIRTVEIDVAINRAAYI
jgi:hypothetical protein